MKDIKLDRQSRYPLYLQAADRLRERIVSGLFSKADPLPDERSLSSMIGISRMTLRKSLAVLECEGLIYKIKGSGVFVKHEAEGDSSGFRMDSLNRRIIALSMPENIEYHYSRVMEKGAVDYIHDSGCHALVLRYMDREDRKRHISRWEDVLSGLIFFRSHSDAADSDIVMFAESLGIPSVFMGAAGAGNTGFDQVGVDNRSGSCLACSFLLENPVSDGPVAMLKLPYGAAGVSGRVAGYIESIRDSGAEPFFPDDEDESAFKPGLKKDLNLIIYGYMKAERILRGRDLPSGILCESDLMAVGVLNALEDANIDVPGQVQIIGFGDDVEMHTYYAGKDCPLSTVSVPRVEEGRAAVEMLFSRMADPSAPTRRKLLDLKIKHRKTTINSCN